MFDYIKKCIYISLLFNSVVLFAAVGDLDTTFNPDGSPPGTVITDPGAGSATTVAVGVQSDCRVVVAGIGATADTDLALIRYLNNGTLDSSFGTGGIAITTPAGNTAVGPSGDIALQEDGKIIFAFRGVFGGLGQFAIMRFNSDGSVDTSFGTAGLTTTIISGALASQPYGVVIQEDGKIVVAGETTNGGGGKDVALVRYTTAGILDTTFAGDGIQTLDVSGGALTDEARGVALQADGKIVVAGQANGDFLVARFTAGGTLDTGTFNSGTGYVTTNLGGTDVALGVGVLANGLILAGGDGGSGLQYAAARYTAAGVLDTTYGTNGFITTVFPSPVTLSNPQDAIVQSNGQVIVGGFVTIGTDQIGIVRFTAGGAIDTTFGDNGFVISDFSGSSDTLRALAFTPGERKLYASSDLTTPDGFLTARYINGILTTGSFVEAIINKYFCG